MIFWNKLSGVEGYLKYSNDILNIWYLIWLRGKKEELHFQVAII